MDLKGLKDWFFEVVAILIPGALGLIVIFHLLTSPTEFNSRLPDWSSGAKLIAPFQSTFANAALFGTLAFVFGHFLQSVATYVLAHYSRMTRPANTASIEKVFSKQSIRDFLVPPNSGFDTRAAHLSSADFFMMIYPAVAKYTKRDQFIAIADFSGATSIVALGVVAASVISTGLRLIGHLPVKLASSVFLPFFSVVVAYVFATRCLSFRRMAESIVVNCFLSKFGECFRLNQRD